MFDDFVPHERLRNGHAMTLWAWVRPRRFPRLPPPESRIFDVATDARVLAQCHWQRARTDAPTIIVLHGLEGSSEAHYVRGVGDKAWAGGFNVVRLNHGIGIQGYLSTQNVAATFEACPTEFSNGCPHGVLQAYLESQSSVDSASEISLLEAGWSMTARMVPSEPTNANPTSCVSP